MENTLFGSRQLNINGKIKAKNMEENFRAFHDELHYTIFNGRIAEKPGWEGREWAIVRTKLEEASFYAKKALATQTENQET